MFGQLPVAIQGAAGLFNQADTLGQHHQAGRRGSNPRVGQRQRLAGQVSLGKGQETTHAVVEDQHRITTHDLDTATPVVDQATQHVAALQLDQSALIQAAPERQQRGIIACCALLGKHQGHATPGFRRMNQSRAVGGMALAPGARHTVAAHLDLDAAPPQEAPRADGVQGIQQSGLLTRQFGGQQQFNPGGIAQTGGDQQPFGQAPGRAVKHGRRATGTGIEPGGIHHQHGSAMTAQELSPRLI